jgi:hypothetical protein
MSAGCGSRVLPLTREEAKTKVEEVCFSRKMRLHHSKAVRIGV